MADFIHLADLGYGPQLIPVIPPDAQISSHSRNPDMIAKNRGKIPGRKVGDGWVGFANFTSHVASPADHAMWTGWGAGAGLLAAAFPALDIDVEDRALVARILETAQSRVGYVFGRVGRPPRVLLPFRAAPGYEPRKMRLETAPGQAIELLGTGQQYVIDGIHPKTGQPYSWGKRGFPEADRLPLLDAGKVESLFAEFSDICGVKPSTLPATTCRSTEGAVSLPPSFDALADLVGQIPNDLVYDTWISVGCAIKACSEGADAGLDLWVKWSMAHPETTPEACAYKWASFQPPFRAGWDTLRALAPAKAVNEVAQYDFTKVDAPADKWAALYARYIWVENLKLAFDTETSALLDEVQFAVRNNALAPPRGKQNAWAIWLSDASRLRRAATVTYRPGKGPLVTEKDRQCVNTWVKPNFTPLEVSDDDVSMWLRHVEYLIPDAKERETLFDWLSVVVQRQDYKPNWQVVWGSTHHGVGKDLALQPMRLAIGERNIRNIQPEQIVSQYTDWFENARLIVVEDMKAYGKRELESRLRPLMASPPEFVSIQKKFMPVFDVPNLSALIFLTNEQNALPISQEDRRYFVIWTEAPPKSEAYYESLVDWYREGGAHKVASWLASRDVANVSLRTRAPTTSAKSEMIEATMSPLEAWLEENIRDATGPFAADIVEAGDVLARIPKEFRWDSGTPRRLGNYLVKYGATALGARRYLGRMLPTTELDRGRLYAVRRLEMYSNLDDMKLVELFWKQRGKNNEEQNDASEKGSGPIF